MLKWIIKLHKESHLSLFDNRGIDRYQELADRIELIKSETREDVVKRFYDFKTTLENELACEYLLKYLEKTHSEENLQFWKAVQRYKSKKVSESHRLEEATLIFYNYLRPGAKHEISIQGQIRNWVSEQLKHPDPSRKLFDDAVNICVSVMENTTWPEFVNSPHFQKLLIEYVSSFFITSLLTLQASPFATYNFLNLKKWKWMILN